MHVVNIFDLKIEILSDIYIIDDYYMMRKKQAWSDLIENEIGISNLATKSKISSGSKLNRLFC